MIDPIFNKKHDSRIRIGKLTSVIQRAIVDYMESGECGDELTYHEMNSAFIYLLDWNTQHAIKAEIEKEK